MKQGVNVCIVGAGSSYTPELIEGISHKPELGISELRLHDIDLKRLEIMAGLTRRMLAAAGCGIKVTQGTDLATLLPGADFVVTQIRVGGMAARDLDETIPLKYGVVGQETTGPGGMFKALRTIPQMLDIAQAVEKYAPQAFILNYTNPSGIVTEALCLHSRAKTIGLCSGIPGVQHDVQNRLKSIYPDLKCYSAGLNHLGFLYKLTSGGRDVTAQALRELAAQADHFKLAETIGAAFIGYVDYFLRRGHKLAEVRAQTKTRACQIMDIEAEVFRQAADEKCSSKPAALAKRGGGGYSDVTFAFMEAILRDTNAELVCSVLNRGCIKDIADDAAIEVTCRVGADGAKPLPVGELPLAFRGLVQAVKAYETLTVEAAIKKEKRLVVQALLNHPLCQDIEVIEPMVKELLQAHGLQYK
jgi:6-phospho-beta-glucosidase